MRKMETKRVAAWIALAVLVVLIIAFGRPAPSASQDPSTAPEEVSLDDASATTTDSYMVDGDGLLTITADGTYVVAKDTKRSVAIQPGVTATIRIEKGATLSNTADQDTISVARDATLTLEGEGAITNDSDNRLPVLNSGTATISGITITRDGSDSCVLNHGGMTIDGASVMKARGDGELVENGYESYNSDDSRTGYVSGTNAELPELTIKSGAFQGGGFSVANRDGGKLTIDGGEFTDAGRAALLNLNEAIITGGAFKPANAAQSVILTASLTSGYDAGALKVAGGTFDASDLSGQALIAVADNNNQRGSVDIEGGAWKGDLPASSNSLQVTTSRELL